MNRTALDDTRAGAPLRLLGALAFSLLLIAAAAPAVCAQDGPRPPHGQEGPPEGGRQGRGGRGGAHGELFRRLGLTEEQHQRLREIRRQSEPEGRALMRRLGQARRALDEAVYAETLDEAAVEERARELAAAQAALVRHHALNEVRVRQVLTPEQLQTFRELRQQARLEQRGRRRREGGPAPADRPEVPGPSRRRRF